MNSNISTQSYNGVIPLNTSNNFEYNGVIKTLTPYLDIHSDKLHKNLINCQKHFFHIVCTECGRDLKVPISCNIRICKVCEKKRYFDLRKRLKPYFPLFINTKHLVLTFQENKLPTHEVKRKCELFCRQFRRSMVEKGYTLSGFRALECVPKPSGLFHIHFHYIISSSRFIPQPLIKRIWEKTTGGSWDVYITKISKKTGIDYVLKYITKPLNVDLLKSFGYFDNQIINIYKNFFYQRRMFAKIGAFYNLNPSTIKNSLVCLNCGSFDFLIIKNVEEDSFVDFSIQEKLDWGGKYEQKTMFDVPKGI